MVEQPILRPCMESRLPSLLPEAAFDALQGFQRNSAVQSGYHSITLLYLLVLLPRLGVWVGSSVLSSLNSLNMQVVEKSME